MKPGSVPRVYGRRRRVRRSLRPPLVELHFVDCPDRPFHILDSHEALVKRQVVTHCVLLYYTSLYLVAGYDYLMTMVYCFYLIQRLLILQQLESKCYRNHLIVTFIALSLVYCLHNKWAMLPKWTQMNEKDWKIQANIWTTFQLYAVLCAFSAWILLCLFINCSLLFCYISRYRQISALNNKSSSSVCNLNMLTTLILLIKS